jgi:hypothetical protein
MRLDDYALPKQHLVPPPSQRKKLEKAFLGDETDHETNLVHVPGQHHPGADAVLAADQTTDLVLLDLAQRLKVASHHGTHLVLVTRYTVSLRQLLK